MNANTKSLAPGLALCPVCAEGPQTLMIETLTNGAKHVSACQKCQWREDAHGIEHDEDAAEDGDCECAECEIERAESRAEDAAFEAFRDRQIWGD